MVLVASLAIWAVYVAGWVQLRVVATAERAPVRPTVWGTTLWLAVAVPSLVQLLAVPSLVEHGRRDPAAIRDGEWWRLATSMFLQDGGWGGLVFNLVTLAGTVLLAGALVRGWTMPVVFVVGGVLGNVLTVLILDLPGAGNSIATMVLLVTTVLATLPPGRPSGQVRLRVGALLAAGVVLLAVGDQHGLAVVIGVVLGAGARVARTRRG